MKSTSTRRTRLNATEGRRRSGYGAMLAATTLVTAVGTSTVTLAAETTNTACPPFMLRPEALASVDANSAKLRRAMGQWRSEDAASMIARDLKAELRLKLPREVMQSVRPQVLAIDRSVIETCYPQLTKLFAQLDDIRKVGRQLSDAEADARQVKEEQASAATNRDFGLVREQMAQQAAEQREAAERTRQELAVDAQRREQEQVRAELARRQIQDRVVEQQKREAERPRLSVKQQADVIQHGSDSQFVASLNATPETERKLYASYRSLMIVRQCFDSLAGSRTVYITRAQMDEAQSSISGIEQKLLSATPGLDKDAVYAKAKAEEDRLADDSDQNVNTPRGAITRRTWSDESKAFCEGQLKSLREAAGTGGAPTR